MSNDTPREGSIAPVATHASEPLAPGVEVDQADVSSSSNSTTAAAPVIDSTPEQVESITVTPPQPIVVIHTAPEPITVLGTPSAQGETLTATPTPVPAEANKKATGDKNSAVELATIGKSSTPSSQVNDTITPGETASSEGGAMNTAYLSYLSALNEKWTDCPSVELVYKNLSYTIHNDATIADAASVAARQKRAEASASGSTIASKAEENIPDLWKATVSMVKAPLSIAEGIYNAVTKKPYDPETVLTALYPTSGVIRPGTMTLVLAPPGAGKSTYLRALTGRLNGDEGLSGDVYFNGLSLDECLARDIHVTRLCSYVGQADIQFPVLTVSETLEFARLNGVGDVNLLRQDGKPNVELESMDAKRTTLLMELLGMMECKDTIIGSDMLRGISGGQKKRSQIGESLMSNARLYALDEVSNGLDSAVTLHIFSALKQASKLNGSSVITALQQVTPETYSLFDEIVLMREGHVVYHGPRTEIGSWLKDIVGIPFIPDSLEEAGFLIELLSDSKQALDKAAVAYKVQQRQKAQSSMEGVAPIMLPVAAEQKDDSDVSPIDGAVQPSAIENEPEEDVPVVTFHTGDDDPLLTNPEAGKKTTKMPTVTKKKIVDMSSSDPNEPFKRSPSQLELLSSVDEIEALYLASQHGDRVNSAVESHLASRHKVAERTMDKSNWSPYTLSQYGQRFPHSTMYHTALCCQRQTKLLTRNLAMVIPRIFSAIVMGLVYGLLFFDLATNDFASKLGLIQNAVMFVAFQNFQELPVAAEGKQIVVRQVDAGFYPPMSYTIAVNLLTLPLVVIETVIFGIILYFISGFATEADRFFFWLFLLISVSSAMSQMFRTITYIAGKADVAQQLNMPFIMLFVIFGGFLIPRSKVPDWLIWAYYLSPFSWATDSLGLNEFTAGKYSDPDPANPSLNLGESYLDSFGLRYEKVWQWAAVAYLWGFYLVLTTASTVLLGYSKPTPAMGAKRPIASKKGSSIAADPDAVVKVAMPSTAANGTKKLAGMRSSAKASFQLGALPFQPATLAWKDLKYTVFLGKEKTPKVLLNNISGYAEPGKLIALMGASGAGKTTLMDVIAGRKTTGLIEFESNIFVNGRPKDSNFEHLTGYVEQNDIHVGQATVREALEFSALLRLPKSVDKPTREAFINEVMELVGLTQIQNRMIGDAAEPSLSTGQLKLLTIATELVANPAIIFLDEPTSGLDSKSAYRVMRAIKRIAATNRTVVCTIHQPSQEVFFMFDRLLLLRRGGEVVYNDDIGVNGEKLVNYLTRVSSNLIPYTPLISPANWMLDVIGLDASSLHEEKKAEDGAAPSSDSQAAVASSEPAPSPASSDAALQKAFKAKALLTAKSSATGQHSVADDEALASKIDELKPFQFSDAWSGSEEAKIVQKDIDRYAAPADGLDRAAPIAKEVYVNDFVRLGAVTKRAFISHWRSPAINITRFTLMLIIGLFMGFVYLRVDVNDFAGLNSLLAAVFLGVSIPSSIVSEASLAMFFRQRAVFYRESSVKMYGYKIYTAVMTILEVPYLAFGLFCFLLPFYFMTGLSTDAGLFFQFYLASYIMVLFFSFLNQVYLAALPNIIAAQALNGLFMSLFFAFGGLFIKPSAIPIGWKWFYYVDPIPKAFIATMLTQLQCSEGSPPSQGTALIDGCRELAIPGMPNTQAYRYVADLLEGSTDDYWPMIGWMILTCAGLRIISVYLFKTINHISR